MYHLLRDWARRTVSGGYAPDNAGDDELIYRLRQWPMLAQSEKTARIYRTLSVMSNRPVNRRWILSESKLAPHELEPMLQFWIDSGWVEVIDPSRFTQV